MRISEHDTLDALISDLSAAPVKLTKQAPRVVKRHADIGNRTAQRLARERSGPHGKDYFKRLSAEMTGPLTAEYGPTGTPKSDFVGAGFRHGINTDLPDSADLIGPKFAKAVGDLAEGLFW